MLSIIVTAVALFVFGALWYTVLFGKLWQKWMEFDSVKMEQEKSKGMIVPLILNFIVSIVIAWGVYSLFQFFLPTSFSEFFKIVFIGFLAFGFPIYVNQALWEGKSWKLVALNSSNGVLSVLIASLVIYFM